MSGRNNSGARGAVARVIKPDAQREVVAPEPGLGKEAKTA
jgi:hypothetical protein